MLFKFDGYIFTNEFDPNFPGYKKNKKYVPLHNYIYWKNTGLIPKKGKTVIHHIDGNRNNNNFKNLELISLKDHGQKHYKRGDITIPKITIEFRKNSSKNSTKFGLFGFKGNQYINKKLNPWQKVWRARIGFNKKQQSLGYFNDPLSCEIVYNLVQDEIFHC